MANPKPKLPALPASPVIKYLGAHPRGLDHGRIIIPPEWRLAGWPKKFMVMEWPLMKPECLLVLSPALWQAYHDKVAALAVTADMDGEIKRRIGLRTYPRALDSYGRLPLPENAAGDLGIQSDVTLVGRVTTFEIWATDRFQAREAGMNVEPIAAILNSVKV